MTKAIALLRKYGRQYPDERAELIWRRVYPEVIRYYTGITEVEQADARQELRERVRWRLKTRRNRDRIV